MPPPALGFSLTPLNSLHPPQLGTLFAHKRAFLDLPFLEDADNKLLLEGGENGKGRGGAGSDVFAPTYAPQPSRNLESVLLTLIVPLS